MLLDLSAPYHNIFDVDNKNSRDLSPFSEFSTSRNSPDLLQPYCRITGYLYMLVLTIPRRDQRIG